MVKAWRLTRNYSIASLIGIALVAVVLVVFYRQIATDDLVEREGQANKEIARILVNSLWPKYGSFLHTANQLTSEELKGRDELNHLRHDIFEKIQGLRIAKVKIYDLGGRVIFSTQTDQIGTDREGNAGFRKAREGIAITEIIYRDQRSVHEQKIFNKNLITSYIPIRRSFDEPVEGVFEIYSDATPMVADIEQSGYRVLGVVLGLFLLLYLFLLTIVYRADQLIARYNREKNIQQQQRLSYLERYDEETGLYNRQGIHHVLTRVQQHSFTTESPMAVFKIQLVNFNGVSDSLGHNLADKLFRLAAERIRATVPGGGTVGRSDSSKFIVILENHFADQETDYIVSKLHNIFAEPFCLEGKQVTISLAIGVCVTNGGEYSTEQLLMNVGTALSVAKITPSQQYVLFDERLEAETQKRFELEQDLSRAIAKQEFTLYYQPRVAAVSEKVVGMEALMRWQHPQRGLISPDNFIDVLEASGKIIQLTPWLLERACSQCQQWNDSGFGKLRVAVNISFKQLHADNFLEMVIDALDKSGLEPRQLELELTERVLAEDIARTGELLKKLKQMGVFLSLDDFGTGYSSLSYLMHFPFDYLKIDRSFIKDIYNNHEHASLTTAIIAMAKSINLRIVAEGVETVEQLVFVTGMECDEIQGFYFSEAVAPDTFIDVMRAVHNSPPRPTGYLTH